MAESRHIGGIGTPRVALQVRASALWLPAAVLAVAICYFFDPNPRLDFSRFDLRDAESYLALSRALVSGVGYTRNLDPQYYIPHTTWPPGLPVMLMPAMTLAGMPVNLTIVKTGMIAYGALGIVLAHLYARRLSESVVVRLGMPLVLAFDPYYWLFSRMVLTEVPTVVWALLTLLLAEIGWGKGDIRPARALAFGLVAGWGMMIRGSLFGALFLPLVYLLLLRPDRLDHRRLFSYVAYVAGFVAPFAVWKLRCSFVANPALGQDGIDQLAMLLRTHPVDPASPLRSLAELGTDLRASAATAIYVITRTLIPGLWDTAAWNRLGIGATPLAAVVTVVALAVSCMARRNLPIILLYGSMAALNLFYAAGAMARLWIPVAALLAVSLLTGLERLSLFRHRSGAWLGAAAGAALAASLILFIAQHDAQPYRDSTYSALAELFQSLRESPPLDGNVLTPNPQAFALVTGDHAPMPKRAIGVDPDYSYIILPTDERTQRLRGTLVRTSGIWSLVKLDKPLRVAELRARIDCKGAPIAAFAVIVDCPMW